MRKGFTLLELMIGCLLFTLVLAFVVLEMQTSSEAIEASTRGLPVQLALQNAADGVIRIVRESKDVSGGGTVLQLTQWDGSVKTISFGDGTISYDGAVMQTGIQSANFQIVDGEAAKLVTVSLTALPEEFASEARPQTLTTTVSLRNVAAGASNPSGQGSQTSQNPPSGQQPPAQQQTPSSQFPVPECGCLCRDPHGTCICHVKCM